MSMTDTPRLIGVPERLATDTLSIFHRNPRQGDIPAITDSLKAHGQFRPIVVNKGTHTGRANEVLAGNHTVLAARELDGTEWALPELDAYVVDVDDNEADRIVLADNRTSDLGGYDDSILLELLEGVGSDLEGTGWAEEDLTELLEASATGLADLDAYVTQAQDDWDTAQEATGGSDEDTEGEYTSGDSEDATGPDDDDTEDATDVPELFLALTFSVTPEQRSRIRAILRHIREEQGLESQADALVWALDRIEGVDVDSIVNDATTDINQTVDGDPASAANQKGTEQ